MGEGLSAVFDTYSAFRYEPLWKRALPCHPRPGAVEAHRDLPVACLHALFYLHVIVLSISRHKRPPPRKKDPRRYCMACMASRPAWKAVGTSLPRRLLLCRSVPQNIPGRPCRPYPGTPWGNLQNYLPRYLIGTERMEVVP